MDSLSNTVSQCKSGKWEKWAKPWSCRSVGGCLSSTGKALWEWDRNGTNPKYTWKLLALALKCFWMFIPTLREKNRNWGKSFTGIILKAEPSKWALLKKQVLGWPLPPHLMICVRSLGPHMVGENCKLFFTSTCTVVRTPRPQHTHAQDKQM